jgi:hypothetical protein
VSNDQLHKLCPEDAYQVARAELAVRLWGLLKTTKAALVGQPLERDEYQRLIGRHNLLVNLIQELTEK